jgi:hypothetical protein
VQSAQDRIMRDWAMQKCREQNPSPKHARQVIHFPRTEADDADREEWNKKRKLGIFRCPDLGRS